MISRERKGEERSGAAGDAVDGRGAGVRAQGWRERSAVRVGDVGRYRARS